MLNAKTKSPLSPLLSELRFMRNGGYNAMNTMPVMDACIHIVSKIEEASALEDAMLSKLAPQYIKGICSYVKDIGIEPSPSMRDAK